MPLTIDVCKIPRLYVAASSLVFKKSVVKLSALSILKCSLQPCAGLIFGNWSQSKDEKPWNGSIEDLQ